LTPSFSSVVAPSWRHRTVATEPYCSRSRGLPSVSWLWTQKKLSVGILTVFWALSLGLWNLAHTRGKRKTNDVNFILCDLYD
jgi:hypothetical protein